MVNDYKVLFWVNIYDPATLKHPFTQLSIDFLNKFFSVNYIKLSNKHIFGGIHQNKCCLQWFCLLSSELNFLEIIKDWLTLVYELAKLFFYNYISRYYGKQYIFNDFTLILLQFILSKLHSLLYNFWRLNLASRNYAAWQLF